MEFSREEIIKSLKCCHSYDAADCDQCAYRYKSNTEGVSCVNVLIADALAIIKELTDENFLLKQKRANMFEILDAYGRGRVDAVRKFANYLKEHSFNCDPGNGFSFDAIDVDELDDYVKEFLEEDK
jgi:hypothetical protein